MERRPQELLEEMRLTVGEDGELESVDGEMIVIPELSPSLSDRIRNRLKRDSEKPELREWWFTKFLKVWYLLVTMEYSAHIGLSIAQIPIPTTEMMLAVILSEVCGPLLPVAVIAAMADDADYRHG